jgi:hypothetical protein
VSTHVNPDNPLGDTLCTRLIDPDAELEFRERRRWTLFVHRGTCPMAQRPKPQQQQRETAAERQQQHHKQPLS